ncbi:hypothetical protein QBC32DRAFT_373940 [Pseudoneurospora amorphoporcata]|uniref:Uncharacterized protein n=1 Tax=Pseudoneurospora amorphoporcata TaxID=241081 RepID=A0AAN6SCI5_9PEZI|nr:hypothetical protein QBC32DRAFT_373940 [Pseudoneurospora amorphoporcata]
MSFNAATLIPLKGENNLNTWARALKYLFDFIRNSISSVINEAKNNQTLHKCVKDISYIIDDKKNYTNIVAAKVEVKTKEIKEIKTKSNGDERSAYNVYATPDY